MAKTYFASKSQCTRTAGDPGGACNAGNEPRPSNGCRRTASRAVFSTNQQLLNSDTDQTKDLYEYVLPTASDPNPSPDLIQVSGAAPNAKVRNISAISDDGRRVYFIAQGVLAENHDAHDEPPFPGDFNLYVWEQTAAQPNGVTKFVTRLEDFPLSNTTWRTSTRGSAPMAATWSSRPSIRWSKPIPTTRIDVYRYDAVTGEMTRVSVDTAGVGGNADFTDAGFGYDSRFSRMTASRSFSRPRGPLSRRRQRRPRRLPLAGRAHHTYLHRCGRRGSRLRGHRRVRRQHLHHEPSAAHRRRHRLSHRRL